MWRKWARISPGQKPFGGTIDSFPPSQFAHLDSRGTSPRICDNPDESKGKEGSLK